MLHGVNQVRKIIVHGSAKSKIISLTEFESRVVATEVWGGVRDRRE